MFCSACKQAADGIYDIYVLIHSSKDKKNLPIVSFFYPQQLPLCGHCALYIDAEISVNPLLTGEEATNDA